jgi:hypothetical protein
MRWKGNLMNGTRGCFRDGRFRLAVMAVLLVTGTAGSANAEIWCRRDFGRDDQVCVFSTLHQCVTAAGIVGGICERQSPRNDVAKYCAASRSANSAKTGRRAPAPVCDAS